MSQLKLAGVRVGKHVIESLAKLVGDRPLTAKEVAKLGGVTTSAIYARRRRFEKKSGKMMPRIETRGRKVKPPEPHAEEGVDATETEV